MSLKHTLTGSLLMAAIMIAACSKSPSATGDAAAPSTAVITGIADCDDFLNAYEQCVSDKIPAESRAQMKIGMEQWKSAWKTMAENTATRDTLPQVCTQARDATAPAMKVYGCTL